MAKSILPKIQNETDNKNTPHEDLGFIIDNARNFFHVPKEVGPNSLFQYCYIFSLSNDFSGHVTLFNSMYSFYRGLTIASFNTIAISTVLIIRNFTLLQNTQLCIFFGLQILSTYIFNNRKKRFWTYTREKILITFDILSKGLID